MRQAGGMASGPPVADVLAAASAACGLVLVAPRPPAGRRGAKSTTTTTHHASPKLAQLGHVKFWECPSKTTQMLVAVNTLTLHPGETLDITSPSGTAAPASCNYTAPFAGDDTRADRHHAAGRPCGSIGFEIASPHGHEVWPGPQLSTAPPWASRGLPPTPLCRERAGGTRTNPTAASGCSAGQVHARSWTTSTSSSRCASRRRRCCRDGPRHPAQNR